MLAMAAGCLERITGSVVIDGSQCMIQVKAGRTKKSMNQTDRLSMDLVPISHRSLRLNV